MDTRQVIARFEAERQALALMDHPHIARVFDGGATESGRPYFVMELVKGVPITEYCDANQLTPKERLELFVSICHAVQHAHQKGVIHRDVKPSNVLEGLADGDEQLQPLARRQPLLVAVFGDGSPLDQRFAVLQRHQHVGRFDVAVDNAFLVGMLDSLADVHEQLQAFFGRELALVTVLGNGHASD